MNLKITILEKQLLHLYFDNPEYLDKDDYVCFFSRIAQDFYITLMELLKNGFTITGENILTNSNSTLNIEIVSAIANTEYQVEKYDFYVRELQKFEIYQDISNNAKKIQAVIESENKDITSIFESKEIIEGSLEKLISNQVHNYLDMKTLLKNHQEVIQTRLSGDAYSSGDFLLDKALGGRLQGGVAILAANSGMGKSTVAIYWAMIRIIKKLPTFVVNTELSLDGWMDNILPSLLKDISYDDLANLHKESFVDPAHIQEQIEDLKLRMENRDKFLMYPHSFLSLADLEKFIIDCRLHMKLEDKIPLFGVIDLLSMITEFSAINGGSRADNIEIAMNKLNSFCLEHNTFLLATVQLRRKDKVVKIETEEDLLEFKPSLESIKSSSAYEERARWVFGLYAPYRVVRKNQCNPVIRDMVAPITTLTLLKDSYNRQEGMEIQYLMDVDKKMFMPYIEENDENA